MYRVVLDSSLSPDYRLVLGVMSSVAIDLRAHARRSWQRDSIVFAAFLSSFVIFCTTFKLMTDLAALIFSLMVPFVLIASVVFYVYHHHGASKILFAAPALQKLIAIRHLIQSIEGKHIVCEIRKNKMARLRDIEILLASEKRCLGIPQHSQIQFIQPSAA